MTGLMTKVQVACDRCSQGVMDATNDHLLGICKCKCHSDPPSCGGKGPPVRNCECGYCKNHYRYLTNFNSHPQ